MCETKWEREVGKSSPDETNSKRDVLLIILTPGVRLNERGSQTRQARCKFNYREEMGRERRERKEKRAWDKKERPTDQLQIAREKERGQGRLRQRNSSIYMTAVCLGRLLMGRKRVVVIKETWDSIHSGIYSALFAWERTLSRLAKNDVFLCSSTSFFSSISSIVFLFLKPYLYAFSIPFFSLPPFNRFVQVVVRLFLRFRADIWIVFRWETKRIQPSKEPSSFPRSCCSLLRPFIFAIREDILNKPQRKWEESYRCIHIRQINFNLCKYLDVSVYLDDN